MVKGYFVAPWTAFNIRVLSNFMFIQFKLYKRWDFHRETEVSVDSEDSGVWEWAWNGADNGQHPNERGNNPREPSRSSATP